MEIKINLTDKVIDNLKNMVMSMKPGDKLPTENELAELYSVSRSTLRESLKVLSSQNLIIRNNEGTFVAEPNRDCLIDPLKLIINMEIGNLIELIELRELLEISVIKLAVQRATIENIETLERINWQMKEPGISPEQLQKRDFEFHYELGNASGNIILAELAKAVRKVIADELEDSTKVFPYADQSEILHSKLIETIKERDEEKALKVINEYLMVVDYKA